MNSSELAQIRGPKALWTYLDFSRDKIEGLTKLHREYGSAVAVEEYMPWRKRSRLCLVLSGVENNRRVLSNPDSFHSSRVAPRGGSAAANRLNEGLIGMNGKLHKKQRRTVKHLFAPRQVANYFPSMTNVITEAIDRWPVETPLNVSEQIANLTLDISASNLLAGSLEEARSVARMFLKHYRHSWSFFTMLCPFKGRLTPLGRHDRHAKAIFAMVDQLIDRRMQKREQSHDMLDQLIAIHQNDPVAMPRERIAEQISVIFTASHETVAKAVTWTLFLLSQHPHVMEAVEQELHQNLGGKPPQFEELSKLSILEAAANESMRLFPPVPLVRRKIRSFETFGGQEFLPGDHLVLSHYITHRCPEVYSQPQRFDPSRWLSSKPDSFAFLPFSAGPRTCIGKLLGEATIKLVLATLLQKYRLTTVEGSRVDRKYQITLGIKGGLNMIASRPQGRCKRNPVTGNVHEMVDLSEFTINRRFEVPERVFTSGAHSVKRAA